MKATNKWGRAIDGQEENGEVKRLGLRSTSIPSLLSSLGSISQAASAITILVGCLVLIGWVLDTEILKPNGYPILTTGLALLILGFSDERMRCVLRVMSENRNPLERSRQWG